MKSTRQPNYELAVITGCLRISRERIFTGLNNLKMMSTSRDDCAQAFGFTEEEVRATPAAYGMESYYHGFLLGLLKGTGKYRALSNRESGKGRPDTVQQAPSVQGKAFILELKVTRTVYGVCFHRKECLVMREDQ